MPAPIGDLPRRRAGATQRQVTRLAGDRHLLAPLVLTHELVGHFHAAGVFVPAAVLVTRNRVLLFGHGDRDIRRGPRRPPTVSNRCEGPSLLFRGGTFDLPTLSEPVTS